MASFLCHAVAGAKQFRLERIVRSLTRDLAVTQSVSGGDSLDTTQVHLQQCPLRPWLVELRDALQGMVGDPSCA